METRVGDITSPHMQWWLDAKFGMFIHWGAYSELARGEWVMNRERWPVAEYEAVACAWNPERYDPREWVRMAQDAGMRYLVCTTKHHDGFCLFGSEHNDYNSVATIGRDLMAELAEACHEADMPLGFYYSLKDWHHPDYGAAHRGDDAGQARFIEYTQGLVRELCSNYGKVAILWYDGGGAHDGEGWHADEMNAMVRELQPGIIINDRSRVPEDHDTPEQHIRASSPDRAWETCMTMNGSWGWHAGDSQWKSTGELIATLARVNSLGGNLLLNVGPMGDGALPAESIQRLREIGDWMDLHGESIYGTRRSPFEWGCFGFTTVKGSAAYLQITKPVGQELIVGMVKNRVLSATLLATGEALDFEQREDRLFIRGLPAMAYHNQLSTVVKLQLEGEPEVYPRWL
ncbi:MAG: alpha-L-fucosidase [candidate division WS1 bacterium]|nr:alpha-L-fucosidase [candidate division WS1 bacterium]